MPESNRDKPRFFKLAVIIAATIAALASLDVFLRNAEKSELQIEAKRFYVQGTRLMAAEKADAAVEVLRIAHSLDRRNVDYELKLVDALIATGKIAGAERLTDDILQRAPNNGYANLVAARLALKTGNMADADPYYHRAIYGEWPGDSGVRRIGVRMELANLLASSRRKKDLLAELLPLQQEVGSDPPMQHRLARLFLLAGSATRATDVYHALIQQDQGDMKAYLELGQAELEQGRYGDAQKAFLVSFRNQPDISVRERLELASAMTALDPTPRRLTSIQKHRRSLRILQLTADSLTHCIASGSIGSSDEIAQLLTASRDAVSGKVPNQMTNELAEGQLTLAAKIWQARIQACGNSTSPQEEPLRLIMEKLAQPSS